MNLRNRASYKFDAVYTSVCDILSQINEQKEMHFAAKLCTVGLISAAERDQAGKIETREIKSRAIVGAVSTMIHRGVLPENMLKRFIHVITLDEFRFYFTSIIEELGIVILLTSINFMLNQYNNVL